MNNRVIAAIVLYQPDMERLRENIAAVKNQVDKVVLVINGLESKDCVSEFRASDDIDIIQNKKNAGIAHALNQAMQYAQKNHYSWVLTLDQDTVAPADLVENLMKHQSCERIGIIAPDFIDRNYYRISEEKTGWEYVLSCITSGCLTNVPAWKDVGGFDDEMFIDYVDYDYCANLIEHGYGIIKDFDVKILHEIGNSKRVYFGKYSIVVTNHSPMRKYYMARNVFYYSKKWPKYKNVVPGKWEFLGTQLIGILFFEKQKLKKLCAVFRGIKDSGKMIKRVNTKKRIELDEIREKTKQGDASK